MLGRTFGDFSVKQRLGWGGGGEVYLAEQVSLGREAVIKVMTAGNVEGEGEAAKRFLREARLASQLDHPFAAHVYGFGSEPDGVLWIAMELVRGSSLQAMVDERGPVPLARFVPFFERLCEVLHAAHEQGIIHRDIKPANVMVISRAGRLLPKLLDLGIARRFTAHGDAEGISPMTPVVGSVELPGDLDLGQSTQTETLSTTLASRLTRSESTELTQQGMLVGTPLYMAPEQWVDAGAADARADLYSLSVLAYQSVTGELPFKGKSIRQLARAHATAPLPKLPDFLPASLHAVLAKGAAKDPAGRYLNAIELGAAVRAASGIGVEPFALPQLDNGLRENLLTEAPQPIAEAVALLEGARTPRQQLDAVVMIRRVVVRYVAMLALACRERVGPGNPVDAPQVLELFKRLSSETLGTDDWFSLAQELCRPFAWRPGAHPLPELVAFFFGTDAAKPLGAGVRAMAEFNARPWPSVDATDPDVHGALLRLVPALGTLLQALGFVFDYALVVKGDDAERWMGTRRARRIVQALPSGEMPDHVPVLVDVVGLPVLTLAPLVQVFTPGAGMGEELFFFDGVGRHGARLVALPGPFERQSDAVWPWFSKNIFDVTRVREAAARAEKPPYKGLSTFTAEDADNYFGREREAESFANRLRLSKLLAVVGPSGSGKSSFILAGVLPLLPPGWRAIVTRPGASPFTALAAKLRLTVETLTPEAILATLGDGESLLMVIDQFEELVTLCQDLEDREAFAELLVRCAEDKSGRLRVVVTLRDDFLIKIQQLRALRERLSSALQLLSTPAKDELLRVVTEPALRVGYDFDDEALPAKMVEEVADYPGALALLSFTASQLWELRDRHLHQMRSKTYHALGGVGGALAHHAEATLAEMTEEQTKLVREAFRHLVTSQATRAVLSRPDMLDVLGNSSSAHAVLEKLVVARLLVTSESASGDDRIEIIHEALIVSWPRLVGWLRDDAETARLRDSLRASARQWADRGRPSGLLWRKESLAEYRVWRARFPGRLTQLEEAFAAASLRDEARARNTRRALMTTAIVALVIGLIVVFRAYQKADASAIEAQHRLADLRIEQARVAAIDDKPFQTLLFAEQGRLLGANGATVDYLEKRAQTKLGAQLAFRNFGVGSKLFVSADQTRLAAVGSDHVVRVMALPSLDVVTETSSKSTLHEAFAFLPGSHVGMICSDSNVYSQAEGQARQLRTTTASAIRFCDVSSDGQVFAALERNALTLWAIDGDGRLTQERKLALDHELGVFCFSRDGKQLFVFDGANISVGSDERYGVLIDTRRNAVTAKMPLGPHRSIAGAFSADGTVVATASQDGVARIFSANDGRPITRLTGHSDAIVDIQVSDDGKVVLTASSDGTSRLWNTTGQLMSTFVHHDSVNRAAFHGESEIVTTTSDGSAHLWNRVTSAPIVSLPGHVSELYGAVAIGDFLYATSSTDGMVRLWDFRRAPSRQLATKADLSFALPTGRDAEVLVGNDHGNYSLWDLATGSRLETMEDDGCPNPSVTMSFSRGTSRRLIAGAQGSKACVVPWAEHVTAKQLQGPTNSVRRVTLTDDGRYVAASSSDGAFIWEVSTGELQRKLKSTAAPRGLVFSSDGERLATGNQDGTVSLWAWRNSTEVQHWQAHTASMNSLEFVRDETQLLTASDDHEVALWDVKTGQLVRRYSAHTRAVAAAHLNPAGSLIASVDFSGTILIWDIERALPVDRILAGGSTNNVAWLPNGQLITGLGDQRLINVYALTTAPTNLDADCLNPLGWNVVPSRRGPWPKSCSSGVIQSR